MSIVQTIKKLLCAFKDHPRRTHLDTARIHAEAEGYVGSEISTFECQDCATVFTRSKPLHTFKWDVRGDVLTREGKDSGIEIMTRSASATALMRRIARLLEADDARIEAEAAAQVVGNQLKA